MKVPRASMDAQVYFRAVTMQIHLSTSSLRMMSFGSVLARSVLLTNYTFLATSIYLLCALALEQYQHRHEGTYFSLKVWCFVSVPHASMDTPKFGAPEPLLCEFICSLQGGG
jgi:TRAP-type uncharacterized transport system fused permease subunit